MKRMTVVISILCFALSTSAQDQPYWNELPDVDKRKELAKSTTSQAIEAFYYGQRPAGDSLSLDALMSKLSKADSSQLVFYFEVFRKKMPAYRDSLPINNFAVHVMNMLTYHTPYVLQYFGEYHDPSCYQMFKLAAAHAFDEMQWFFPTKQKFRDEVGNGLGRAQLRTLDKLLE